MGPFAVLPRLLLAATMAASGGRHSPAVSVRPAAQADTGATKVTPAMIEAGRGVFHGQGGCFACHGMNMQGSAVAPALDKKGKPWVAAKGGTYDAILQVVTHGVAGTIMVSHPNGISDALAAEVAAYVWAVNHSGAKP